MNDSFPDQENKMNPIVGDEISLKEFILKIQEWWGIAWSHKLFILLFSFILGLSSALYTKFFTKPIYTASYQLFFEDESGGLSGAMRLASSFGLGAIGGGSASSIEIVKEFLISRNNIVNAMTKNLENGRLIDRYYAESFEKDEEFSSEYQTKFGLDQRYTDSVLTEIFLDFNEKGIIIATHDEEKSALSFTVNSFGESFTYELANQLVQNTEAKFIDWERENKLNAVKAFQGKVDSLELALDETLRRLGEYQDQNNSLISAVTKMEQMRLNIDMEALKIAYGEYIKGLEMSKADLMNLEPPFKYFDQPTYPLFKEEKSVAKSLVLGSFITGFLLALFFISRKEVWKIMAD